MDGVHIPGNNAHLIAEQAGPQANARIVT
jgi:hypothetical protein